MAYLLLLTRPRVTNNVSPRYHPQPLPHGFPGCVPREAGPHVLVHEYEWTPREILPREAGPHEAGPRVLVHEYGWIPRGAFTGKNFFSLIGNCPLVVGAGGLRLGGRRICTGRVDK